METFETDGAYGRSRDEFRGVPAGMEAFGPVVACEPLAPERWRGSAPVVVLGAEEGESARWPRS